MNGQARAAWTSSLAPGLAVGAIAGLAAVFASARVWIALPAAAVVASAVFAWWTLSGSFRWVTAILVAVLLLPPLPLPWGDTGPHPAVVLAAMGLLAGLARANSWDIRVRPVSAALVALWFALLLSTPFAALYSGPEAVLASLARIALFSISLYLYFYLLDGPGKELHARRLIQILFWAACSSALFACLDFYFQFPAPSRFAEQFVWLRGGVFRRAQGVFYEASTLGLVCVFLLDLIAAAAILRLGKSLRLPVLALTAGAAAGMSALVLSFSRAATLSFLISLAVMVWLERRRLGIGSRLLKPAALALGGLAAGFTVLAWLLPDFLNAYLGRLWYSGLYLLDSPNLVLSRRLESWRLIVDYLGEHPWHMLFGVGYKTLPYTKLLGRPLVADNTYLSLLVETGLAGLGALLLLHAAVLAVCFRAARLPMAPLHSSEVRLLGLWVFCFWCGLAVQMWSADALTYWKVLPVLFAVLAIIVRETGDANPVS